MSETISALAPGSFPSLPPLAGVAIGTHAGSLRYSGRDDLFVAELAEGTSVAGVFTTSLCPSAPVDWCKQILAEGNRTARAVVCNAGNANAFTGAAGEASVRLTAETIAGRLGILPDEVLVASTGVIGEPMPDSLLRTELPALVGNIDASCPECWERAAGAIGTTDTFRKGAARRIDGAAAMSSVSQRAAA